jgi:hypothetical protein
LQYLRLYLIWNKEDSQAFKDLDPKKEVSDRIMVLVLPAMSIALQYHPMH